MRRAIREIQPLWVVAENVRGLINWNGGLVFDQVQADLETEGYEILPFLLPAAGVEAPHRRDRIWFIAHSSGFNSTLSIQQWRQDETSNTNINWALQKGIAADTAIVRQQRWFQATAPGNSKRKFGRSDRSNCISEWRQFPTESPVCSGNDGVSSGLSGITVSTHRKRSLEAYGNAVVPQLVFQIFNAIEQYEKLHS